MYSYKSKFSVYQDSPPTKWEFPDYIQDIDQFIDDIVFTPSSLEIDLDTLSNPGRYVLDTGYDFTKEIQSYSYSLTPEDVPTKKSIPVKGFKGKVINYFMGKGLSEALARGIYGNLMLESGGRLSAVSTDGHDSYGIAQWTGIRKTKLLAKHGYKPSLDLQLDFLWEELNTTETKALSALRKAQNVHDATKVFMNLFERPHRDYKYFERRLKYALS